MLDRSERERLRALEDQLAEEDPRLAAELAQLTVFDQPGPGDRVIDQARLDQAPFDQAPFDQARFDQARFDQPLPEAPLPEQPPIEQPPTEPAPTGRLAAVVLLSLNLMGVLFSVSCGSVVAAVIFALLGLFDLWLVWRLRPASTGRNRSGRAG